MNRILTIPIAVVLDFSVPIVTESQAEKSEQETTKGYKRLIKNAITYWSYLYLTLKIDEADDQERSDLTTNAVATRFVVSWQRICLLVEYSFSARIMEDSMGIKSPKNLASIAL